ncbi:MAG: glycoside hydrolase family 2 [Firmicutes bacterium]|nr:glycoside hydrolase family 2 [Bacillota bacterium]
MKLFGRGRTEIQETETGMKAPLQTRDGQFLSEHPGIIPWEDHPRPQLRRSAIMILNGWWDFGVSGRWEMPPLERRIRVPFAPEAYLSGIHEEIPDGSYLWYRRRIRLSSLLCQELQGKDSRRVLLHVEAADQQAALCVNGHWFEEKLSVSLPVEWDITDQLDPDGENELILRTYDRLEDSSIPYGKQSLQRGGMWYTPHSGIWKTVWLEVVPENYIRRIRIRVDEESVNIMVDGPGDGMMILDETPYTMVPVKNGRARVRIREPHLWTPEDPYLYAFTMRCGEDTVQSYFALRTIRIEQVGEHPRILLNGRPYFFNGLLDQGYWSDGLVTPPSSESLRREILKLKEMGFNTLRKHIKVESETYYYLCDRLGMVVFQDMVNNGKYSYVQDSVLPTLSGIRKDDRYLHHDPEERHQFIHFMHRTVRHLYNHPCICYWTIFNEGWGQFCGTRLYRRLRQIDQSRVVDTASGWFQGCETDVESRHVYFRKVRTVKSNKPWILSEFGGYVWKPEGHAFNADETYGYGQYRTREEWLEALRALYEGLLPQVKKGLCAAIYTQVSDVEDEVNGLFSYDRRILKLQPDEIRDLLARFQEVMDQET